MILVPLYMVLLLFERNISVVLLMVQFLEFLLMAYLSPCQDLNINLPQIYTLPSCYKRITVMTLDFH